jgi:TP901 family phage tail tape measure protein
MQTFGKRATLFVSTPILAAGGASVKMANNFDKSLSLINGLVGLSTSEVERMRESVLTLAGETARSPQELAEALYFITSSGFSGAEALDVLEVSAKGATAGLGDSAVLADLLTSALNAYKKSGLTAAEATDTLTEAVKLGKNEPDELAGSMGRVLPIASEMGVEFHEVAAAFASMSLTGLNADESATAIRGTLSSLLSPSKEAKDALAGVGLSTEQIHESLRNDGLLATLQLLQERFGGNAQATEVVFGNVRALTGVLSILGENSETTSAIFDDMTESTGLMDDAFKAASETAAFKMSQAWVEIQTAMIEVGTILAPVVADVAGGVATIAQAFTDLPDPIQQVILALATVAAIAGPMIFLFGSLIKNLVLIKTGFGIAAGGASTFSKALGAIGIALTLGVMLYDAFTAKSRNVERATDEAGRALGDATIEAWNYADAAAGATGEIDGLAIANAALASVLTGSTEHGEKLRQALGALGFQTEDSTRLWSELLAATGKSPQHVHAFWRGVAEELGYTDEQAIALADSLAQASNGEYLDPRDEGFRELAESIGMTTEELATAYGEFLSLNSALQAFDDGEMATRTLNDIAAASDAGAAAVKRAQEAVKAAGGDVSNSTEVYRQFLDTTAELPEVQQRVILGLDKTANSAADAGVSVEELEEKYGEMTEAALTGAEASEILAASFEEVKRNQLTGGKASPEQWAWIDALKESLPEVIDLQREFVLSGDKLWENSDKFSDSIDENTTSLLRNTEGGRTNRGVLADWSADIIAHAQNSLAQGNSVASVTQEFKNNRQAMIDAALAAGMEKDEVDDLLDSLGMADGDWEAAIKLSGDKIAMDKITAMLLAMEELTEPQVAQVQADLETGGAWFALEQLRQRINATEGTVDVNVNVRQRTIRMSAGGRDFTIGNVRGSIDAAGAYVPGGSMRWGTTGEIPGRAGDEVILPLGNPGRMAALLGMSEVGPRVAAAMAGISGAMTPAASYASSGGSGAGASGGDIHYHVNVHNNGRDLTPMDLDRAMRRRRTAA